MPTSMLLFGLVFSSIGIGYFIYGRKQSRSAPKYSGLALMVYPYFIADVYILVGIGLALLCLPFIWKN